MVGLHMKHLYIYVGVILVVIISLLASSLITGFPLRLGGPISSSETGYSTSTISPNTLIITYGGINLAYVLKPDFSIKTMAVNSTAGGVTVPLPGKISVMTFQYIRCPDICHWETYVFVYLMNKTASHGLSEDIVFITLDVDPWRTTFEDVTAYQKSRARELLNKVDWIWVLENVDNMTKIWENFRVFVARDPNTGLITHSVGFYIFNRNGEIVYIVQPTEDGWKNLDKLAPSIWELLYKVAKMGA